MTLLARITVMVLGAAALAACQTQDYDNTACSGHLGCSARQRIGPTADDTAAQSLTRPVGPVGVPAVGVNAILKSTGCGKALPEKQAATTPGTPKGYTRYTVMGTGETLAAKIPAKAGPRTFWVRVPQDYDPNRAYRVVYIGQGCGGFGIANTSTLPLYKEKLGGNEQAIYVALDIPEDRANMDCYDNRDGLASQEWEAFELFHTVVEGNYCVDNNRIYVAGYSTGGWLSNMWGCYFAGDDVGTAMSTADGGAIASPDASSDAANASFDASADASSAANVDGPGGADGGPGDADGDGAVADASSADGPPARVARKFAPKFHIRGQASVTGGEPASQPACNGPVAAIWIHDASDHSNEISGNISALTRVGKMNGCDTKYDGAKNQKAWHPEIAMLGDVCKQFVGCPANYPVVFCTTNGLGHADQAERATTAFNAFFNQLNPLP